MEYQIVVKMNELELHISTGMNHTVLSEKYTISSLAKTILHIA